MLRSGMVARAMLARVPWVSMGVEAAYRPLVAAHSTRTLLGQRGVAHTTKAPFLGEGTESKAPSISKEVVRELEAEQREVEKLVKEQREILALREQEFESKVPRFMMVLYRIMTLGGAGKKSSQIRASHSLYELTLQHVAKHPQLYKMCHLEENKRGWFALTVLHAWMLLVRLRSDEQQGQALSQEIFNHFWADLERRLCEDVENPFVLGRYQKDAFQRYHGTVIALDEGLAKGDTVLAGAVFRNILSHGAEEAVDGRTTARVLEYIHRSLKILDLNKEEDLRSGFVSFGTVPVRFGAEGVKR